MKFAKKNLLNHSPIRKVNKNELLRGEGDGSSFPNGNLRSTSAARAYFLWDWKSPLFIKKSNQVMYIPSMLISHNGDALDDRTTYRKAETAIEEACEKLLNHFKIKTKGTSVFLGLEQ